ncbi:protein of unknown function [Cupriavidus taiwanensis]|nr:protein of unknown function [Cupriavidus taiwanensis]
MTLARSPTCATARKNRKAWLLDGKRALFLSVVKAQGQNTVDTVDGLVRMTDEVRKLVPAGVQLNVVNDTARASAAA